MSFGNTKTPCKPTGEAKYQIPMRATARKHGFEIIEGEDDTSETSDGQQDGNCGK